jgi:flagellar motility protein MotE (MotC chaperone)
MRAKSFLLLMTLAGGLIVGNAPSAGGEDPAPPPIDSLEQRRLLFSLQEERDRLQQEYAKKEEKLAIRELELKTLEGEVDKKLTQLQEARNELSRLLEAKDEVDAKRTQDLGKMYEKMDPAQGAVLLAELEQELAVRILAGMKPKAAGALLSNMPPDQASRLSAAYSTLVED